MRILFDTNILIAAFTTHGVCKELFEYCLSAHTICVSPWIIDELSQKLSGKFDFPRDKTDQVISFIKSNLLEVTPIALTAPVCRDCEDDHILASAAGGEVDCLITGDEDLLVLKEFQGIPILKPGTFWKYEKQNINRR